MPKLTFHGHATWEIEGDTHRVLIDPYFSGNPVAKITHEHFETLDAILVTHAHSDHICDVEAIAKKTGAVVVSNDEIARYFEAKGCTVHKMHIGGGHTFPFGHVKLTIAHHGSTTADGITLGQPAGVILTMDGRKIYHLGDTGVFLDMQLISELNGPFDVALIPIGDNFTMGVKDATKACEFIQAKVNIPMHYNTFPVVQADPEDFAHRVRALGQEVRIIEVGESTVI